MKNKVFNRTSTHFCVKSFYSFLVIISSSISSSFQDSYLGINLPHGSITLFGTTFGGPKISNFKNPPFETTKEHQFLHSKPARSENLKSQQFSKFEPSGTYQSVKLLETTPSSYYFQHQKDQIQVSSSAKPFLLSEIKDLQTLKTKNSSFEKENDIFLRKLLFSDDLQEQKQDVEDLYRVLTAENNHLTNLNTFSTQKSRIRRNSKNLSGLIKKALLLVSKVEELGEDKKRVEENGNKEEQRKKNRFSEFKKKIEKLKKKENFEELKSLVRNQNLIASLKNNETLKFSSSSNDRLGNIKMLKALTRLNDIASILLRENNANKHEVKDIPAELKNILQTEMHEIRNVLENQNQNVLKQLERILRFDRSNKNRNTDTELFILKTLKRLNNISGLLLKDQEENEKMTKKALNALPILADLIQTETADIKTLILAEKQEVENEQFDDIQASIKKSFTNDKLMTKAIIKLNNIAKLLLKNVNFTTDKLSNDLPGVLTDLIIAETSKIKDMIDEQNRNFIKIITKLQSNNDSNSLKQEFFNVLKPFLNSTTTEIKVRSDEKKLQTILKALTLIINENQEEKQTENENKYEIMQSDLSIESQKSIYGALLKLTNITKSLVEEKEKEAAKEIIRKQEFENGLDSSKLQNLNNNQRLYGNQALFEEFVKLAIERQRWENAARVHDIIQDTITTHPIKGEQKRLKGQTLNNMQNKNERGTNENFFLSIQAKNDSDVNERKKEIGVKEDLTYDETYNEKQLRKKIQDRHNIFQPKLVERIENFKSISDFKDNNNNTFENFKDYEGKKAIDDKENRSEDKLLPARLKIATTKNEKSEMESKNFLKITNRKEENEKNQKIIENRGNSYILNSSQFSFLSSMIDKNGQNEDENYKQKEKIFTQVKKPTTELNRNLTESKTDRMKFDVKQTDRIISIEKMLFSTKKAEPQFYTKLVNKNIENIVSENEKNKTIAIEKVFENDSNKEKKIGNFFLKSMNQEKKEIHENSQREIIKSGINPNLRDKPEIKHLTSSSKLKVRSNLPIQKKLTETLLRRRFGTSNLSSNKQLNLSNKAKISGQPDILYNKKNLQNVSTERVNTTSTMSPLENLFHIAQQTSGNRSNLTQKGASLFTGKRRRKRLRKNKITNETKPKMMNLSPEERRLFIVKETLTNNNNDNEKKMPETFQNFNNSKLPRKKVMSHRNGDNVAKITRRKIRVRRPLVLKT